ncbi:Alginate lyase [Quadrisphaera granulorum]|uniref:Alginate lyase n=2 Tax=Quadrisphaera granulorum TaxID=317664 RepID=A0A316B0K7_9ACTN|nr:alginate lyase [Quadrisphaera granulorum]SZE94671.1 Alginate lyase [Quadrisphaera granulorum]
MFVAPHIASAGEAERQWSPAVKVLDEPFDADGRPSRPPVGGSWSPWASPGVSLTAGEGQLRIDGMGAAASFALTAREAQAADVRVSSTVLAVPTGGAYYAGASARVQPDGRRYALTVVVRPDGEVALVAGRVGPSGTTPLGRTSTSAPLGTPLVIELQATGSDPTVVKARAWADGTTPPAWQLTTDDDSQEEIAGPGGVGVNGYLSRSASDVALSVDSVQAWSLVEGSETGAPVTASPTSDPTTDPTSEPATDPTTDPTTELTTAPTGTTASATAATGATAEPSSTPLPGSSSVGSSSAGPSLSPTDGSTAAGFAHPGIVMSAEQLVFVRSQIAAGREPWTSALARARGSWYARSSWTPRPVALVQCGSRNNPDIGCTAETDDAQAAYTNALLFSLTGERPYADKAIEILDAWSAVLQGHSFDTTLYKNGRLQAAWAGQTFTKAAELVRYSRAGWAPEKVARFEGMLRTAFLPMVRDGWTGGGANWQLSMADATMNIGVFLDDRAVFDDGVGDWRAQVVSAFYLTSDGPQPIPPLGTYVKADYVPTYWFNPLAFVDGQGQETCRDLGHTAMGLGAALNAAETAAIQGVDLYGEQRRRLVAAMEYNSRYLADPSAPGWVCPRPPDAGGTAGALTFEIGLRHYGAQEGLALPSTRAWVERNRPTRSGIFMNWETLTHGS